MFKLALENRSTIHQIIRLQDLINTYLNSRGLTVEVFLDFKKALDMLWHKGLLIRLKILDINGKVFDFITNFLTDRTMQVRVEETLWKIYKLENGSPQGSILSPLLFLIMINDTPKELFDVESSLFADDSAIFKSGKNLTYISTIIQTNSNKISEWCDQWGFKISTDKPVCVVFTRKRIKLKNPLMINGKNNKI